MFQQLISQPFSEIRLGDYLNRQFEQEKWTHFYAAIAFVKKSGTHHISKALRQFSKRANVKIIVGIDLGGSSKEGLNELLDCVEDRGEIQICHNDNSSTFHPKIYIFKNESEAFVIIGSGNLTEGGLYTNYEASFALTLNLEVENDKRLLQEVESTINYWANLEEGTAIVLNSDILEQLVSQGKIPEETKAREIDEPDIQEPIGYQPERKSNPSLFVRKAVPNAPRPASEPFDESISDPSQTIWNHARTTPQETVIPKEGSEITTPIVTIPSISLTHHPVFLMTLQRTDVGFGQVHLGTSRRSPEIFIPLIARDRNPDFWGFPSLFTEDTSWSGPVDSHGRKKMDRNNVRMRIGANIILVNMFYNPSKRDLRLRSEALRSAGNIDDILRIEAADGSSGFDYYVEIIPKGTTQYAHYLSLCVNTVRNSLKRWGYY